MRSFRQAQGLTIEAIAREFEVSKPTWSTWELGTREPKLDVISTICARLNCTPNDLLGVSPSSSITVTGNGNAVSQGSGASARAVSWKDFVPGAVAGKSGLPAVALAKAGELPQCARCEHRKLAERMRKMLAGK